ncbi:helix-turn-helix domain-containing protein [Acetilactobacillus jinshanensis]|uniref:XRE family transcriptional regulator n=1 Tax=Acetilactobacillus jinshanensis TaxID=1720083 RepID=A0A4P6ZNJ0_9LACO|nr:helix-turn-helix transcriptional regulator [Acetilactobacillus jinshanensis]QBP18760.1 XRE family transcriptional regulator [Acetilactobacillus jinshanensis]URL61632.1 helix-turn-helix transcriptional regulator [uncultured bacterium]
MKVSGKIIKHHRINSGLSQYQLADGICAQATISLIENRNSCPKLGILARIGQRLNIPIHSVIRPSINLVDVEEAILQDKYQKAKRQLSRIPVHKFKVHHQMPQYFCYQGLLSYINDDDRDALYYFHKTVIQNFSPINKYYRVWANLGISCVYFKQKDYVKSLEFAKVAKQHLNFDVATKIHQRVRLFIVLRLKLAKLFYQLKAFKISNAVCFQTISDSAKIHSMYKLRDVYTQISQNYLGLNQPSNAESAKRQAHAFHHVYQHPESLPSQI